MTTDAGSIISMYRFPVKSMLGEQLIRVEVTERGLAGDRAYGVIDLSDGKVASAKHPRKWGRLLECTARYVEEPTADSLVPPIEVCFPDGSLVRSDSGRLDEALSAFVGRDVTLSSQTPEQMAAEEVWPSIDGLAPLELVRQLSGGRTEGGEALTDIPLATMAPSGSFFDLTTLHLITTSTLRRLSELEPSGTFDVRRYRPNLLVETPDNGFVENGWVGATLAVGGSTRARVDLPTMRCVMTTLAQGDLPADRSTLRAIATHNRLQVTGMGSWACAGIYASITEGGTLRVGDRVAVAASTVAEEPGSAA